MQSKDTFLSRRAWTSTLPTRRAWTSTLPTPRADDSPPAETQQVELVEQLAMQDDAVLSDFQVTRYTRVTTQRKVSTHGGVHFFDVSQASCRMRLVHKWWVRERARAGCWSRLTRG